MRRSTPRHSGSARDPLAPARDAAHRLAEADARGTPRWLVTVREAAQIAAVSTRSIWAAIARGDLVAVRLGSRTTRIEISSIEAWIDRAKARPAR